MEYAVPSMKLTKRAQNKGHEPTTDQSQKLCTTDEQINEKNILKKKLIQRKQVEIIFSFAFFDWYASRQVCYQSIIIR